MVDKNNEHAPGMLPSEFHHFLAEAIHLHGETAITAILAVHRTTLMRWRTRQARIPAAAARLVEVLATGRPPQLSAKHWNGFRFTDRAIITPDGREYTPKGLCGMFWVEQQLEAQQRKIARLQAQLDAMMAERDTANDPIARPGATDGADPGQHSRRWQGR